MKLNLGENIRRLRRAKDWTQDDLADRLGTVFSASHNLCNIIIYSYEPICQAIRIINPLL